MKKATKFNLKIAIIFFLILLPTLWGIIFSFFSPEQEMLDNFYENEEDFEIVKDYILLQCDPDNFQKKVFYLYKDSLESVPENIKESFSNLDVEYASSYGCEDVFFFYKSKNLFRILFWVLRQSSYGYSYKPNAFSFGGCGPVYKGYSVQEYFSPVESVEESDYSCPWGEAEIVMRELDQNWYIYKSEGEF